MREVPYSSLRFKNAPVRRRIFWSALAGVLAAVFLGDYVMGQWTFPNNPTIIQGIRLHIEIPIRTLVFFCTTLLAHFLFLCADGPRFQYSIWQLLMASIVLAMLFSVLVFPHRASLQFISRTESANFYTYGWPLPLCTIIRDQSGDSSYAWEALNCILIGSLLVLSVLNILFFKAPRREDTPSSPKTSEPQA